MRKSNHALDTSTFMRGPALAAVAIVAILVGAGLGYLAGANIQRTVTQVVTTTQLRTETACANPSGTMVPILAASSANSSQHGVLTLVLSPGSNATVLVDYCGYGYNTGQMALKPSALACTVYGCREPSSNVTISPVPSKIILNDSAEWIVAYHISANLNSKGHYLLDLPLVGCPPSLLAVGFSPSELKISDFSGWGITPCPYGGGAEILSVEGAATTYVGF
jgi:hypothetical protein